MIIPYIFITIYLISASYTDIKKRVISVRLSLFFLCSLVSYALFISSDITSALYSFLTGTVPGLLILALAFISRQSIGYGDGILVIVIGTVLGIRDTFMIICMAFILSAIAALFLIRKKSGTYTLPFVPFISAAYGLLLFQEVFS